jgi:hypothetical protein
MIYKVLQHQDESFLLTCMVIYLQFNINDWHISLIFNIDLDREKKGGGAVGKQTHDLTVIASDSKTTQSGGDNRKKFPLGAALQVPQNFSFAPL